MNRETFITLNKTRLFTADQVVDIVKSEIDKMKNPSGYCSDCGDKLIYSHRVTINSWSYICRRCKLTYHITENETTKEREIDVYNERGDLHATTKGIESYASR